MSKLTVINEFIQFARGHKKLWLLPIIFLLLLIGVILVVGQTSVVGPLIYTLF